MNRIASEVAKHFKSISRQLCKDITHNVFQVLNVTDVVVKTQDQILAELSHMRAIMGDLANQVYALRTDLRKPWPSPPKQNTPPFKFPSPLPPSHSPSPQPPSNSPSPTPPLPPSEPPSHRNSPILITSSPESSPSPSPHLSSSSSSFTLSSHSTPPLSTDSYHYTYPSPSPTSLLRL